jgi:hypothetical protein
MKKKQYRPVMKFDIIEADMVPTFKDLNFKLSSACLEISEFGGLFFLCKNFRAQGTQVFQDPVLSNHIMVFKANGDVYARLTLRDPKKPKRNDTLGEIIGAKFIRFEKILLLFDTAKYLIFCPSNNKVVHTGELTPKGFFSHNYGNVIGVDLMNAIVGMTTFEDSMAFWTRGGALHLIQDVYKGERTKLMDNMFSMQDEDTYLQELAIADHNRITRLQPRSTNVNNSEPMQFKSDDDFILKIFPDPAYLNSKKRFFVFPHIQEGLWVLSWNGHSVSKKRILERISDPIIHLSFSYKRRRLAVLTSNLRLEIYQIEDLWKGQITTIDSIQLNSNQIPLERLRGLNWIKDYVVCFCFIDKVHFLVVGAEKTPNKFIKAGEESKMDRLFYRTEVDGLRVMFLSPQPGESANLLYKVKSKAIMDTENISSIHEAAFLYKWYQTVSGIEGVRMVQRDLRQEQDKLLNAISTILKAMKFKDDESKMTPLLKAAAFGKLYISNEEDTKRFADKIFDMVKLVKVWISWKREDQRAISFKQFYYLGLQKNPNRPFRDMLDLFIHNGSFALAKNLINLLIKNDNAINYLFRPWAKRIMDVKLKNYLGDTVEDVEVTVAQRIRFLFRELALENPHVKASEILEIAEDALKRGYKTLAKELLKIQNPPILKIGFYLKMEEFESALEESVHCNDSHYIYLIFKKFCTHISQSPSSKFNLESLAHKIQKMNNQMLSQHLMNFLDLTEEDVKSEIVDSFRPPLTFLISSSFAEILEESVEMMSGRVTTNKKRKAIYDRMEQLIGILDKTVTRSREYGDKGLTTFIEKKLKLFYYYLIIAKEIPVHEVCEKYHGYLNVGSARILEWVYENNEEYDTGKKFAGVDVKEFKDKNKNSDWNVHLARVKHLFKLRDLAQVAIYIKSNKLYKVDTFYFF